MYFLSGKYMTGPHTASRAWPVVGNMASAAGQCACPMVAPWGGLLQRAESGQALPG
jgi:hypothetical protein